MLENFLAPARSPTMSEIDFNGTWNNQHGSEMTLSIQQHSVTGKYRTAVGAPGPTEEFDLTGFCSGDIIAFAVNFGAHGSLTAWVGQVDGKPPDETLHTMWHLARNVEETEEPDQLWAGVLTGSDRFSRGPHG